MKSLNSVILFGVWMALVLHTTSAPAQADSTAIRRVFLPVVGRDACAYAPSQTYHNAMIDSRDTYYKDNRLTDNNPDFRLQVLGYAKTNVALQLVDYSTPGPDPDAPKFTGIFEPERVPVFKAAYERYDWKWNEAAPPPYGSRLGLNKDFAAAVLDLATTPGETLSIPRRGTVVWDQNVVAMVLFADERNVVLTYTRQDTVSSGYTVYMSNFCVEPGLVSAYRAVIDANGRRTARQFPAVRNSQPIGKALGGSVTVAIRDTAQFMDPRSRRDWWAN